VISRHRVRSLHVVPGSRYVHLGLEDGSLVIYSLDAAALSSYTVQIRDADEA